MRANASNLLILGLLGLLAWQLLDARADGSELQGGGGDANRDVIAVTGTYGSGASVLYLFDTKTRHLAVYRTRSSGQTLEFIAARDCQYDFYLESFGDSSQSELLPKALRRGWQRFSKETDTGGPVEEPAGEPEKATGAAKGKAEKDR